MLNLNWSVIEKKIHKKQDRTRCQNSVADILGTNHKEELNFSVNINQNLMIQFINVFSPKKIQSQTLKEPSALNHNKGNHRASPFTKNN